MNSIMTDKTHKCYICGSRKLIEMHHVYFSTKRKISEQNGFKVPLCREHHTGNGGVHFNIELDYKLKETCQRKFEETHTHDEFVSLINKNYI